MQQTTGHQIDLGINTTTTIDNGMEHQCIITQENQHQNQYAQNSHINNNQNFSWNWPTPEENTMNIQQTLSRIMGSKEEVGARVNHGKKFYALTIRSRICPYNA